MSGMSDDSRETKPEETSTLPPIVLKNGSLKDRVTGHFLPGVRPTSVIASSERGRELVARRRELAGAASRRALVAAASEHIGSQVAGPAAAVGVIAEAWAQSALANAMDKPRESVMAGMGALKLAGMAPAEERSQAPAVAIQINVSADVAASIARRHAGDEADG